MLALSRVDELVYMLSRPDEPQEPERKPKRPINLEPSPEEIIEHIGVLPDEMQAVAETRVFMCPTCDDTGMKLRADSMGKRRSTGMDCPDCVLGRGAPLTTIHLRCTDRIVSIDNEFAQRELEELATLSKDGVDRHVRKLAKLFLDYHNNVKQSALLSKRANELGRREAKLVDDIRVAALPPVEALLRNPPAEDRTTSRTSGAQTTVFAITFTMGRGTGQVIHDMRAGDALTTPQQTHLENALFERAAMRNVRRRGTSSALATDQDIKAVLMGNPSLQVIVDNHRSRGMGDTLSPDDVAALERMRDNIARQMEEYAAGRSRTAPTAQRKVKRMYAEHMLAHSPREGTSVPDADAETWNVRLTDGFGADIRALIVLGQRMPDAVRSELTRRINLRPRSPDMVAKCQRFLRAEPTIETPGLSRERWREMERDSW